MYFAVKPLLKFRDLLRSHNGWSNLFHVTSDWVSLGSKRIPYSHTHTLELKLASQIQTATVLRHYVHHNGQATHFFLLPDCLIVVNASSTSSSSPCSVLVLSASSMGAAWLFRTGLFFALDFAFVLALPRKNLLQALSSCNEGRAGMAEMSKRLVLLCKLADSPKVCMTSPSWSKVASTVSVFSTCLDCLNSRELDSVILLYLATVWKPSSPRPFAIAGSAKHSSNFSVAWVAVHPHFLSFAMLH